MIMLNAVPRQIFAIVTQTSAGTGADRKVGLRAPNIDAAYAMMPAPDSSSSSFQMIPMTTPGSTQPTSTMARTSAAPGACGARPRRPGRRSACRTPTGRRCWRRRTARSPASSARTRTNQARCHSWRRYSAPASRHRSHRSNSAASHRSAGRDRARTAAETAAPARVTGGPRSVVAAR